MSARVLRTATFASNCVCASTVIVTPSAFIHYNSRLLSNRTAKSVSFGIDPKKLDLKLNWEQMDVKAMVSATNEAIVEDECGTRRTTVEQAVLQKTFKDKTKTRLKGTEVASKLHESKTNTKKYENVDTDNNNTNSSKQQQEQENIDPNDAELEQLYSQLTSSAQNDSGVHQQYRQRRNVSPLRTVRGIVNAGAVHDTRSTSAAYAQRATEMKAFSANDQIDNEPNVTQVMNKRGNTRYSLMDALRDCALNGNWSRSYHFFTEALEKACKAIVTPVNTWNTFETKNELSQKSKSMQTEKELDESEVDVEEDIASLYGEKLKANMQSATGSITNQKEEELWKERKMLQKCFRIFRGVNATLTPQQRQQAWHFYASSLVGIMRWNTGHFYMLVKVLIECHRTKELHEVWVVMKEIGIVEYMFDERSVNSFISLIRRSHNSLPESPMNAANTVESDAFLTDGTSGSSSSSSTSSSLQETSANHSMTMANRNAQSMNDIRREMVLCLAELARRKEIKLIDANERTALTARIAAALREGEKVSSISLDSSISNVESGDTSSTKDNFVSTSQVASDDINPENDYESSIASLEGKLTVKDFNTLLRQAQSNESTERLLALMQKLNIALDASSYASIISSLHSPLYKVCDDEAHTEQTNINNNNNNSRNVFYNDNRAEWQMSITSKKTSEVNEELNDEIEDDNSDAKRQYEAHKDRRIAYARKWFSSCPAEMRTISVYNEMLYLLRAKRHIEEFNKLLITLRGNTVRTDDGWLHMQLALEKMKCTNSSNKQRREYNEQASEQIEQSRKKVIEVNESRADEDVNAEVGSTIVSSSLPNNNVEQEANIMPADWQIPPNSSTYELLVQRARYLHDWSAMWQLYVEMKQFSVNGTARLYQVLLSEAENHPPRTWYGEKVDSGTLVLQLYEEMRQKKMDTNSLSSTVSLVRA